MTEITYKSVFDFKSYKDYILARLGPPGTRRGGRSKLANALNCQTTFVSQVLNGPANFSLEQAHLINGFFEHDEDEAEAFIYLVLIERAGSKDLEGYFWEKYNAIVTKRLNIKRRLKDTKTLSNEARSQYYSQWHYAAIHMLLSIPEFQNRNSISQHLNISLKKTNEILTFLLQHGLAEEKDNKILIGPTHIHLEKGSADLNKHHTNWRMAAIQHLENQEEKENLHYSVVYSLSRADSVKIKDEIIKLIKKNLDKVKDSPEEVLYCNTIDFFQI